MKAVFWFSCIVVLVVGMNACSKTAVNPDEEGAIGARSASVAGDSAKKPHSLTVVAVASLPATVTGYISATYVGAAIKEARKDKEGNFWVSITIGSDIKLLLFKPDGTFVKEVGRPPHHASGDSTHRGKHMRGDSANHPKPVRGDSTGHNRPGAGSGPASTTVAVSSLPAAITTYINTNYAGATIDKAAQAKKDSDYIVLITTADKKRAILEFAADGTFKRARTGK